MANKRYVIGFSNVDEQNPFTVEVRESLQAVAATLPNVELVVRNNNRDTPTAIRNSQEFAQIPVDVAIIFHIDEREGQNVVQPLRLRSIPIICVDVPIARTVYFGINNRKVGADAGIVLADWINRHWQGQLDKTLVLAEYRVLDVFRQRFIHAVDQLEELVPTFSRENTLYLDNGDKPEITAERVAEVLARWHNYKHIAIVCMNDDVAIGALDAIEKAGRHQDIALLSHDGTQVAITQFQREPRSAMIVSTLLRPQEYGERLIELALQLAAGERVPPRNYVHTVPLTRENFRQYVDVD